MIKEDTEDPDKEIIDLIVELRENSNLVSVDEKSFSRNDKNITSYNAQVLRFTEPLHGSTVS
jgi:hypothetical protein